MPTYAVKLGDLDLISDEPITPEQRTEVMNTLKKNPAALGSMMAEGLLRFRTSNPPVPLQRVTAQPPSK